MSKRKFSKKEVAISIAAAALAIATVGGAVAIHKDSSNSNTGHSITVEQSDYSKKKEEAIQQIQDAVKDLSDDQQSEIDSYIKQNIENIRMRFLYFIKQHNRVRFPPNSFCQLTTFVISYISRRCSDQT